MEDTKAQIAENGLARYRNRCGMWPRSIHGRATQNASNIETVEEKINGCFGSRGRANAGMPCPGGVADVRGVSGGPDTPRTKPPFPGQTRPSPDKPDHPGQVLDLLLRTTPNEIGCSIRQPPHYTK